MSKDPTLSVCMIVRNEEANLPRALASVRGVADEVIVVDTGSTDRTVEIAEEYGARIYHFDWCDDFSAARNESLRHATKDYIMWLDGDDELEASSAKRLKKTLKSHRGMALYFLVTLFFENHKDEYHQIRIFPRKREIRFEGRVHEQPNFSMRKLGISTFATDLRVIHHGYQKADDMPRKLQRNLKILESELAEKPGDIIIRFFIARTHMGLHRFDETVSLYREIIEDAEKDAFFRSTEYWRMSYLDIINVLVAKNMYGEAKGYVKRYADTFGPDFLVCYFMGNILMREEDYGGALKEFLQAERIGMDMGIIPIDASRMIARLHAFTGFCLAKEGRSTEAEQHIGQALRGFGSDEEVLDSVSNAYIVLKDKENLSAVLSGMTPGTGKYHYKSGVCRIYNGDVQGAISELEKAVSLGFRTRNCLLTLMMCYEDAGQFDEALALGEESSRIFQGDREFSKRLLTLYMDTSRYNDASAILTGLNCAGDPETMAAGAYLSALNNDWEKMLAHCVELHLFLFPGMEPSLENIIRLEEALFRRGERLAASHIKKTISAFIKNSPF